MSGAYNQVHKCEQCGETKGVKKRRANTAYADDENNFVTCCLRCFKEYCDYFEERLADYYSEIRAGLYL